MPILRVRQSAREILTSTLEKVCIIIAHVCGKMGRNRFLDCITTIQHQLNTSFLRGLVLNNVGLCFLGTAWTCRLLETTEREGAPPGTMPIEESHNEPHARDTEVVNTGDDDDELDVIWYDPIGIVEDQVGLDNDSVEAAGAAFSSSKRIPNNKLYLEEYFHDHYSLMVPSSAVRFRSGFSGSRVIENESNQIILEERYEPLTNSRIIEVKRVRSSTKGVRVLRAVYTIVCALWVGIFLVFAIQVILSLVLDLSVLSGQTSYSNKFSIFNAIGMSLGLIQLCFTFAEGMVIATRFLSDTWSGHHLVKEFFFMRKNLVFVDWIFFIFLLGIPLVTAIVSLFAKSDDWWIITGITW